MKIRFTIGFLSCLLITPVAFSADSKPSSGLLQADTFTYDQQNEVFNAIGRVELEQDNQMVFADKMSYDRKNDKVIASGNVRFVDVTGQVYFAQNVELHNKLKTGAVQQIGMMFSDGSRAVARSAEQTADNKISLHDGIYSPCNLCKDDPRKAPLWQLRADKVVDDKNVQDIYYHNAKFDVFGVPVLYTPYFSHPEPSVKARSGFLMPLFSNDNKKGLFLRNYYYQNISPHEDVTIEATTTQKAGSLLGAQWRKVTPNSALLFSGSVNRSTVRGGSDDDEIIKPERMRGYVFGDGTVNLDPNWRAGFSLKRTTDNYFLNDFGYGGYDILMNSVYAERFKGRDYTSINNYYFQDLRPNVNQQQPDVLPWVKQSMVGRPNETLGGRWALDNETVTLFRSGEHNVSRVSTTPSWERRDIWPMGLQSTLNGKIQADGYWVREASPYLTSPQVDGDATEGRLFPSMQATTSYPLIRPGRSADLLIEPKAALTLAPNTGNSDRIPNEDSRDIQLDMSNLFNDTRFPGTDRVENGSHVSYGVKFGGYSKKGNSAFATVGQSLRLTGDNPFPSGSGLERRRSDLVGQIEATFIDRFYTDYRFQLNEENLSDRRHELQASYLTDGFEIRTNYIFTELVQGTNLSGDRQQLGFSAAKALMPKWSVAANALHDLSGDSGLLLAGAALQYKNECLQLTLRGERDLTNRLTGGSDSRVMFSIGLRNLGGYDKPLLDNDPLYTPFNTKSQF